MKKRERNVIMRAMFTVPNYESEVWVIVAIDARRALNRMRKKFDEKEPVTRDFGAMTLDNEEDKVGIFFYADAVTKKLVGHEIDHVVESILTQSGAPTQPDCASCKENQALLNGVVTERVHKIFEKHKIEVKL